MNIHTSKCTFLPFLPEKSVKDIPFTASTFTNVQLYRRNKSNTTNLEQGLSNTTTRHVLFTNATNNFTLINCTYTTCILQLLIHMKQKSHHYKHRGWSVGLLMAPPASTEALASPKGRTKGNNSITYKTNKNKTKKQLPLSPLTPVGRTWWELRKHFFPSFKSFAFRRWGSHRRRETLSPGKKNNNDLLVRKDAFTLC